MSNDDKKFIANLINQVKDELGARIEAVRDEIKDVREELGARIDATNARIDSYHGKKSKKSNSARITDLENRVDVIETRVNEHDKLFNKLKVK